MLNLLRIDPERRRTLDILFLAKYAEDWIAPPPTLHPTYGRELYTKFEVLSVLRGLARTVEPCASLEAFEARMRRSPAPDYIFQIYNREAVRNPEILVSSLCARTGVPYLGSPPNVRAIPEDTSPGNLSATSPSPASASKSRAFSRASALVRLPWTIGP